MERDREKDLELLHRPENLAVLKREEARMKGEDLIPKIPHVRPAILDEIAPLINQINQISYRAPTP